MAPADKVKKKIPYRSVFGCKVRAWVRALMRSVPGGGGGGGGENFFFKKKLWGRTVEKQEGGGVMCY